MSLAAIASRRKELGPILKDKAAPVLRLALEDEDGRTRVHAARALWYIDWHCEEVIPTLINSWKENDNYTRHWVYMILLEIGTDGKDAVPVLVESLADKDPLVRQWAAEALKAIDPEAAANAGVR